MPRVQAATMSSPLSPPGTVGNCVAANTEMHSDATAAASRRALSASPINDHSQKIIEITLAGDFFGEVAPRCAGINVGIQVSASCAGT